MAGDKAAGAMQDELPAKKVAVVGGGLVRSFEKCLLTMKLILMIAVKRFYRWTIYRRCLQHAHAIHN